jgi:hypothetical protein
MALWGALEGGRRWRNRRQESRAETATARAAALGWDEGELRTAAIIVEGYAAEAGLSTDETQLAKIQREAAAAGASLVASASAELQSLVGRLSMRHTPWWVRWRYEAALAAMLIVLFYRFGRNFFYDSWLAVELGLSQQAQPVLGTDFFLSSAVVLLLWSGLLLWLFTSRLRRGVGAEIAELSSAWNNPALVSAVFAGLDGRCRAIRHYRQELDRLEQRIAEMQHRLSLPEMRLGHRIG